MKMLVRCS